MSFAGPRAAVAAETERQKGWGNGSRQVQNSRFIHETHTSVRPGTEHTEKQLHHPPSASRIKENLILIQGAIPVLIVLLGSGGGRDTNGHTLMSTSTPQRHNSIKMSGKHTHTPANLRCTTSQNTGESKNRSSRTLRSSSRPPDTLILPPVRSPLLPVRCCSCSVCVDIMLLFVGVKRIHRHIIHVSCDRESSTPLASCHQRHESCQCRGGGSRDRNMRRSLLLLLLVVLVVGLRAPCMAAQPSLSAGCCSPIAVSP
mgnify:CR=1 FL=1